MHRGKVFPQAGVSVYPLEIAAVNMTQLGVSGRGAESTPLRAYSSEKDMRGTLSVPIPTGTPSPVSKSNLIFVLTKGTGTNARSAVDDPDPGGLHPDRASDGGYTVDGTALTLRRVHVHIRSEFM